MDVPWNVLSTSTYKGRKSATSASKNTAAAHPFWAQMIGPRGAETRRVDTINECNYANEGEGSYIGDPNYWPSYTAAKMRAGRMTEGQYVCKAKPGTREARPSTPRNPYDLSCLGCGSAEANSLCQRSIDVGYLPAGAKSACSAWLQANRYGSVAKFMQEHGIEPPDPGAFPPAPPMPPAAGLPSWALPAAVAGGALALVLVLKKRKL